jgi:catechol 2,3-dioxygenase-like lactoylglutathione lyase family enzyme
MDKESIVTGCRHIGIIVENMGLSLHFYRDLLGLKVIQDFYDDSEYINIITGISGANVHMIKLETADKKMVIELLEYLNHPTNLIRQPTYNVGCCHIAFQTGNIDEAYERLSRESVRFLSKPVLSSEKIAKVCFCFDPSDIRIELVEML